MPRGLLGEGGREAGLVPLLGQGLAEQAGLVEQCVTALAHPGLDEPVLPEEERDVRLIEWALKSGETRDPDNAFWGWNGSWLHPDFRRWNIESSLPEVRVPALLVQGEADEYGTPAHVESIARNSSGPVEVSCALGFAGLENWFM